MKKCRNWVILDLRTEKLLHGVNQMPLRFSEEDIAQEVGEQLFNDQTDFVILNIHEAGISKLLTQ